MNAHEFIRARAMVERKAYHRQPYWGRRALNALLRESRAVVVVHGTKVSGWKLPNGEIVCIKQRFKTEAQAQQTIEQIAAEPLERARKPVRAYPCFECNGWHITGQQ